MGAYGVLHDHHGQGPGRGLLQHPTRHREWGGPNGYLWIPAELLCHVLEGLTHHSILDPPTLCPGTQRGSEVSSHADLEGRGTSEKRTLREQGQFEGVELCWHGDVGHEGVGLALRQAPGVLGVLGAARGTASQEVPASQSSCTGRCRSPWGHLRSKPGPGTGPGQAKWDAAPAARCGDSPGGSCPCCAAFSSRI